MLRDSCFPNAACGNAEHFSVPATWRGLCFICGLLLVVQGNLTQKISVIAMIFRVFNRGFIL